MSTPLEVAMSLLTEQQRSVFVARSDGLMFREIGEMLGISARAAYRSYEQAERNLLRAFRPVVFDALREGAVSPSDVALPQGRSSRFRGVSWHKRNRKWMATVVCEGRKVHIGSFPTEESAAHAYDMAAMRRIGPNAITNASLGLLEETNAA